MLLLQPTLHLPYSVLYVDPPWRYANLKTGGNSKSGARTKYRTLSIEELCRLPIESLAAPNAVLALWGTVPLGDEPFRVMRAWGFDFKTSFHWIKSGRLGMGHYFRGNVEPLLFGIRGDVRPFRMSTQVNYKVLPPLRHSAKPMWFRELIEDATFNLPGRRLEIFARERVRQWDATGLDLDGFDIRRLGRFLGKAA